jgi:hypothetical protein
MQEHEAWRDDGRRVVLTGISAWQEHIDAKGYTTAEESSSTAKEQARGGLS